MVDLLFAAAVESTSSQAKAMRIAIIVPATAALLPLAGCILSTRSTPAAPPPDGTIIWRSDFPPERLREIPPDYAKVILIVRSFCEVGPDGSMRGKPYVFEVSPSGVGWHVMVLGYGSQATVVYINDKWQVMGAASS